MKEEYQNYENYRDMLSFGILIEEKLEDMQSTFDAIYEKISIIASFYDKKEMDDETNDGKSFGNGIKMDDEFGKKDINKLISKLFGNKGE